MRFIKFLIIVLFFPSAGLSQGLFDTETLLKIKIVADYELLLNDISDSADYHEARLIYTEDKKKIKLDVQLKARGNIRRSKDFCAFPPLRVNFKKKDIKGSIFDGSDKIKLVTHCITNKEEAHKNVLAEYLFYRIYNIISPISLRVRLAEIRYTDKNGKTPPFKRMGFFIEKTSMLCNRVNCRQDKSLKLQAEQLHKETLRNISLFQYLIKNTDWAIAPVKNLKLILAVDEELLIPVPYDFDFSNVIHASYLERIKHIENTTDVEVRIRGYCDEVGDFNSSIELFNQKKDEIIQLVRDFEHITDDHKAELSNHILVFYETINDPVRFNNDYLNNCKSRKN